MKERPIIFSGPMVRAILEGRKTQTRSVVKPQPAAGQRIDTCHYNDTGWAFWNNGTGISYGSCTCENLRCPYGQPGDRLWVREAWAKVDREPGDLHYRASANMHDIEWFKEMGWRWRPSIHMPRWASRILLEVTDVRVERVQDISEDDAWEEGCDETFAGEASCVEPDPVGWFRELWDGINAKRGHGWDTNPWVWVVAFKVLEKG